MPKNPQKFDATTLLNEMHEQRRADAKLTTAELLKLPDHRLVSTIGLRGSRKLALRRPISRAEKNVALVSMLYAEVNNGGFAQFFSNSPGDYASELALALCEVGLTDDFKMYEEALGAFPHVLSTDVEERRSQLDSTPSKTAGVWRELESRFYADKERSSRVDQALAAYARAHAAEL